MDQKLIDIYVCSECGGRDRKLWRAAHDTTFYCESCARQHERHTKYDFPQYPERGDQIGNLLPAVPCFEPTRFRGPDGVIHEFEPAASGWTCWGYTSVPEDDVQWWKSLPSAAPPRVDRDRLTRIASLGAFDAIAGKVGLDPFGAADPAEVFRRVSRLLKEHEAMRSRLQRCVDTAEDAGPLLRAVDAPEPGET